MDARRTGKVRHYGKPRKCSYPKRNGALNKHARFQRAIYKRDREYSCETSGFGSCSCTCTEMPWEMYTEEQSFPVCDFLGCVAILRLLDISHVERDTIKACVQVCSYRPWADVFLSGQAERARDYLLHVASLIAVDRKNWKLYSILLPRLNSKTLFLCAFSRGAQVCGWKMTKNAKTVYNTDDIQEAAEKCLRQLLHPGRWGIVRALLLADISEDFRGIAFDAALQCEQWDMVLLAINSGLSSRRLTRTLTLSLRPPYHWDVALACVEKGADVRNACPDIHLDAAGHNDQRCILLHYAAKTSQWNAVEYLVKQGCSPDVADCRGVTILHHAVWQKQWRVAAVLFAKMQNVAKTVSSFGGETKSPFHIMCAAGKTELVNACAELGADLDHADSTGHTAMYLAARDSQWNIVELLLERGADPDREDDRGQNVLQEAVVRENWEMAHRIIHHSKRAGELASARTMIYQFNGCTALHLLCERGQVDLLHTLLLMNADPLVQNNVGETLLTTAMYAREGRENLIRVLIQSGMTTHQAVLSDRAARQSSAALMNILQVSPMGVAVTKGMLQTAKLLYASGATLNKEMHILLKHQVVQDHLPQNGQLVLEFLHQINSEPRLLRDLCALKISHLIGCRPGREDRVTQLGLPRPLCNLVLMNQLMSQEFTGDCGTEGEAGSRLHFRRTLRRHFRLFHDDVFEFSHLRLCSVQIGDLWQRTQCHLSLFDSISLTQNRYHHDLPSASTFLARYGLEADTFQSTSSHCSCQVTS
ncbi:hypothetical protein BaRGS_00009005 [Batillaria attramentaria]|uniref:Uncharacterized protein n=1 Tax=Batillaria attramentaria TaxID=370345 RepID=A0ABD0LJH4_9CAEN